MFTITQVSHLGQVNFVPFGNGLVGDLRPPPIAPSGLDFIAGMHLHIVGFPRRVLTD